MNLQQEAERETHSGDGDGAKPFWRGLHRAAPSLQPHHGSALLQLPCRSDPRAQRVHLAVPKCQVPRSWPWLRMKQLLETAVAWRAKGRSQLCLLLWADVGRAPEVKREHGVVGYKGIPAMPLVPGYHLHLPPTPRAALPRTDCWGWGGTLLPSLGNLHLYFCFS